MLKKYLNYTLSIVGKDIIFSAVGLLALGLTEGISLIMIIPLLTIIGLTEQQISHNPITITLTNFANASGLPLNLLSLLIIFVILISIRECLVKQQTVQNNQIQQKIVNAFRLKLFKALAYSNWLFFSRTRHSSMTQTLTLDINRIGLLVIIVIRIISTLVIAGVYLIGSFIVSLEMTLITIASVMLLLWFGRNKLKDAHQFGGIQTNHHNKMYFLISECLAGIKTSKCFNGENRQVEDFADNIDSIHHIQSKTCKSRAHTKFMFGIGTAIILTTFLFIAIELLQLQAFSILALVFLFSRLSPKVSSIQQDLLRLLNTLPALNAYDTLLTQAIANNETLTNNKPLRAPHRFIALENINFSYSSTNNINAVNTLKDINLHITIGQIIAIVGASGAGKSTLADLLMGLIYPQSGEINLDGNPLSQEQILQWRKHIAYVPQDTHLFHDSVSNNLLCSKPDATKQQLLTVLKQANAFNFVMALPQGLDTSVGDRGVNLSGGERQRLALARALLSQPTLLILDEATSALDEENESEILQIIKQLKGKITVVIITHRLSSLQDVDQIYVMNNGKIDDY